MFSTKGVNTQDSKKVSKYLTYGIQQLFIYDIDIKTASTGSKQLTFHMESEPVEGLDAEPGHKGQVGRVAFPGSYLKMDNVEAVKEFNTSIGIIADKLGVRAELDEITAPDFDSYINAVKPLFLNKSAWWTIAGEEYAKQDGKTGMRLKTRRYSFVASLAEGKDHLDKFDISKSYNVKLMPKPDADSVSAPSMVNDLPF